MKILFCGDIVPTDITAPVFARNDVKALMGDALEIIRGCDYAVANLECALTDRETPIRKLGPNLKGTPACAKVLKDCGFTHLGLANNHSKDYGEQGLRDTARAVEEAGIIPFGVGENDQESRRPLFITKDGLSIAVVAVCEHEYSYALADSYGANPFDPFDTMQDIAEAKKNADFVVVMYHGGKEQCEVPSVRLRKACQAMARAGADLILCQHSHCIGCREEYAGCEIVYGQGNFNFVKNYQNPQWRSGLMTQVDFSREKGCQVTHLPVVTTDTGIRLATDEERAALLGHFAEVSEVIQNPAAWMAAWENYCQSMKTIYWEAAANSFQNVPEGEPCHQVFPHYLDCEAHLDVWKTLFKTWHALKTTEITQ